MVDGAPAAPPTHVNVHEAEPTDAVAVLFPGAGPSVMIVCDWPTAFVGASVAVTEPPPEVICQTTGTLARGLFDWSVTTATSGTGSAVPGAPVCPLPAATAMLTVAAPAKPPAPFPFPWLKPQPEMIVPIPTARIPERTNDPMWALAHVRADECIDLSPLEPTRIQAPGADTHPLRLKPITCADSGLWSEHPSLRLNRALTLNSPLARFRARVGGKVVQNGDRTSRTISG